ncbi:MAG: 3'-5' exonuclease, partial [Candidatus Helarchaeales archaeon]
MKIGIVDLETTDLKPEKGTIVEVGIVELDSDTGEIQVLFDSIVREESFGENDRESWIFEKSNLKYEDVLKAIPLSEARPFIQEILDQYPMTSFNEEFDFGFLKQKGFRIPRELPCIMISAAKFNDNNWPKVEKAWEIFFPDEKYVEKHRAVDDAVHEAKILHHMIKIGHYKLPENGMEQEKNILKDPGIQEALKYLMEQHGTNLVSVYGIGSAFNSNFSVTSDVDVVVILSSTENCPTKEWTTSLFER